MENKTIIVGYSNPSKEGIIIHLNQPTALNGCLKSKEWYLSWDKIGSYLFKDYVNIESKTVDDLRKLRGESDLKSEDACQYHTKIDVEVLRQQFREFYIKPKSRILYDRINETFNFFLPYLHPQKEESDSIEFSEWCSNNQFVLMAPNEWKSTKIEYGAGSISYTSKELYQQFITRKNK